MNKQESKSRLGGTDDPFNDLTTGFPLALAVIDTVQEALLILDADLRIIAASKSFYKTFKLTSEKTNGVLFYSLNDCEWDAPALRELLEKIIPEKTVVEEFQIEHDFKSLGQRIMIINARELKSENGQKKILLSIFDVTERRQLERDKERLSQQKDILLQEMRHRIANSLQLIASILLLKAHAVHSEESRQQLQDAHQRIMFIATVQRQLDPTSISGDVPVTEYLKSLCDSIAKSMIGGRKPITIEVSAEKGTVLPDEAVSLGLITTELVINALKHAFPEGRAGQITVSYQSDKLSWKLTVSDNGIGIPEASQDTHEGLGTSIISSLAKHLRATVTTVSSSKGAAITVAHAAA